MEDYLFKGILNHVHDIKGFDTLRMTELDETIGHVTLETEAHKGFSNCYGNAHGGALLAMVDMSASAAAYSLGKHVVTLSVSYNFTRGVVLDGSKIRIISDVVHNGRTTMVIETLIKNEKDQVCLRGLMTAFVTKEVEESDPIPAAAYTFDANALGRSC